jgi:phosphoglycerate kinase
MQTVDNFNFSNEKVLVRVDFNVPLNDKQEIMDNSRMKAAITTIKKILGDGGSVVLMSHLGRPKNGPESRFSLTHLVKELVELTGVDVKFASDCVGEETTKLANELKPGEILLLENLRFHSEEKKGDQEFARQLSQLGTFYVNDAFGTAHRAHASTAVIAENFKSKKCFGYIMAREIANAEKVIGNPQKPLTAIVGGAKVSDKTLIVKNLLNVADNILIGGGMAYTFYKAMGGEIGNSLCEDDRLELCKEILIEAKEKGVNIFLPEDSISASEFSNDAEKKIEDSNAISTGFMGLDIGPKAQKVYKEVLLNSKTILWNGPMGVFEMSSYEKGTKEVAVAVAEATKNGAFSLIGGGDSAAAINKFNLGAQVSYVSTGGGALLEYFEGKELPGIKAIND